MRRRDFVRRVVAAGAAGPLLACGAGWAWEDAVPGPAPGPSGSGPGRDSVRLDGGWRFLRGDPADAASPLLDDAAWDPVTLPHTPRLEALVTGEPGSPTYQWQGVSWYRRPLRIGPDAAGRTVLLRFEAAMNVAEVWLDGERIGAHRGGFLPFVLDVTDRVAPGRTSLLAVRLDNTDDPVTGPKPLELLDFNTYGGLYRYVHLVVKDRLHITDPILADRPAGGGVFVTFPEASPRSAVVRVRTHVRNDHDRDRVFRVRTRIVDRDGGTAGADRSRAVTLPPGADTDVVQDVRLAEPHLWSPSSPYLYTVVSELSAGPEDGAARAPEAEDPGAEAPGAEGRGEGREGEAERVVDQVSTRVGIRRIEISADGGFRINGERLFLRGTNRHQEHPYVGYAVPAAAHYRDARRIKDAGFDYVRLSHYPHAPAFMDACDELGLVVMDCLPGWQYFGEDPAFAELQYRNVRELIRRDRNHPSVVLWEVSLNETAMPPGFVARTHAIAHEEYPGDQCYTCGWVPGYDVFIRARQHGGCRGVTGTPCVVSEYGDWEYYAMTAGLDQEAWAGLAPDAANSRQLRWQGERAMLQQALNFQEAHDDDRAGPAFGDGLWVMFDYNRGYAPDIESSGCMDLLRLPKYSYHFFRSQRPPDEGPGAGGGPMVFIASEWSPASATDIRVFSNCDRVELRLDGDLVARQGPDADRASAHLAHPPFTFRVGTFRPGTLEAIGYRGGREAARHAVRTAGAVEAMRLAFDLRGSPVRTDGKDLVFCRAELRDAAGTVVADAWENVAFGAVGDARLVGTNPFSSDAGIASILVDTAPGAASAAVYALSIVSADGRVRILHAAGALLGEVPEYEVRYTTDGRAPGPGSPRYREPNASGAGGEGGRVRAAVVVAGRVVAQLDEATETFRIRGSRAPATRQPFHRENP